MGIFEGKLKKIRYSEQMRASDYVFLLHYDIKYILSRVSSAHLSRVANFHSPRLSQPVCIGSYFWCKGLILGTYLTSSPRRMFFWLMPMNFKAHPSSIQSTDVMHPKQIRFVISEYVLLIHPCNIIHIVALSMWSNYPDSFWILSGYSPTNFSNSQNFSKCRIVSR